MILPGHLAAGYLLAEVTGSDARIALLASVFPDVFDKLGRYVLRLSPSGRVPAHSLFSALVSILALRILTRRPAVARAWAAGYLAHLATDISADAFHTSSQLTYLLWPLTPAPRARFRSLLDSLLAYSGAALLLEAGLTVVALARAARKAGNIAPR